MEGRKNEQRQLCDRRVKNPRVELRIRKVIPENQENNPRMENDIL